MKLLSRLRYRAPVPQSICQALPPEITGAILQYFILPVSPEPLKLFHDWAFEERREAVSTLKSTALVCRSWKGSAQSALYHTVDLLSIAAFESFFRTLRRKPTFRPLVRVLNIFEAGIWYACYGRPQLEWVLNWTGLGRHLIGWIPVVKLWTEIELCVEYCTSVKELRTAMFIHTPPPSMPLHQIARLVPPAVTFDNLRCLQLIFEVNDYLDLLSGLAPRMTRVEELVLVKMTSYNPAGQTFLALAYSCFPRLTSLALYGCTFAPQDFDDLLSFYKSNLRTFCLWRHQTIIERQGLLSVANTLTELSLCDLTPQDWAVFKQVNFPSLTRLQLSAIALHTCNFIDLPISIRNLSVVPQYNLNTDLAFEDTLWWLLQKLCIDLLGNAAMLPNLEILDVDVYPAYRSDRDKWITFGYCLRQRCLRRLVRLSLKIEFQLERKDEEVKPPSGVLLESRRNFRGMLRRVFRVEN